jgi:hypothetical protein
MGIGSGAESIANALYIVGTHVPVAGHRDQLQKVLSEPTPSKVQTGNVLLQHIEGGDFQFVTITRYSSWQDLGTDRAAAAAAAGSGWSDVRDHSARHRDTITDRIYPK